LNLNDLTEFWHLELSELIVTGIASPGENTLDAIINSVLDGVMLSPK
jgi:hypothetical protein